MKQITNKTVLTQSDVTYQPVEIKKIFYWVKETTDIEYNDFYIVSNQIKHCTDATKLEDVTVKKIVAQSERMLPNIPVVNQSIYVSEMSWSKLFPVWDSNDVFSEQEMSIRDGFYKGFESNTNQYSLNDIINAIELARDVENWYGGGGRVLSEPEQEYLYTTEQIIEQINSIKTFHVDEQFKILSYE